MRKHSFFAVMGTVAAIVGLFVGTVAYAATPTFSLSSVGGGSVEITVNGDPNSSVTFYYPVPGSSGTDTVTLGSTNSSGSFSTTINGSSYDITGGESVYVIMNGQQSGTQTWPYSTTSGSPSLSQASVTVGLGQSMTITAENNASVYMESNSSPSVASIVTNGSQITVTGVSPGSTTASICYTGTSSSCTNLSVTAQTGNVSGIAFSQNNLSISPSASQSVTVSGGDGTYSVSSNSNTSVASANLSGNALTVYGIAAGSATITVCDSNNTCGTLSVTVGSSNSNSSVIFSQTNPTMTMGQSLNIALSGASSYSISSNPNSGIVTAGMNGTTLALYASNAGSDTITVCATSGGCSTITVTVSGSSSNSNGSVVFGTTNPTITVGQSVTIGLSGGSGYFVSSNASPSIVEASMSGSEIVLYGSTAGSDSLTVCATSGGCSTLTVTVAGTITTVAQASAPTTAVTNSALLTEIQSLQSEMSQLLTQIQTMETNLSQVESQVSAGAGSGVSTNVSTVTNTSSGTSYDFTELLTLGSQDAQVTALQNRLTALGFYTGPVTGFYGALTQTAVEKYQTAHDLTPTGYVGPGTRTTLNAGE